MNIKEEEKKREKLNYENQINLSSFSSKT